MPLATAYHYNIHGPVGDVEEYSDLLDLLRYVGENDVVYLHLNTPGGYIDTTVDLVHRIKSCQATVVGCADGMVASAGSILFFACNGWEVGEFAQFMLHDGSDGHVGKTNENVVSAKASASRLSSLYRQIYGPFFKGSEIKKVLSGQDLYLTCDEVVGRLEKASEKEVLIDSTDTNA